MTQEELEIGKQWLMEEPRAIKDLEEALKKSKRWALELYVFCRYGNPKQF